MLLVCCQTKAVEWRSVKLVDINGDSAFSVVQLT